MVAFITGLMFISRSVTSEISAGTRKKEPPPSSSQIFFAGQAGITVAVHRKGHENSKGWLGCDLGRGYPGAGVVCVQPHP